MKQHIKAPFRPAVPHLRETLCGLPARFVALGVLHGRPFDLDTYADANPSTLCGTCARAAHVKERPR